MGRFLNIHQSFRDLDVVLLKLLNKNLLINYGLASLDLVEQNHRIDKFYEAIVVNSTKPGQ